MKLYLIIIFCYFSGELVYKNKSVYGRNIIEPHDSLVDQWECCNSTNSPNSYLIGSFDKVIVEFLNKEGFLNKSFGLNYTCINKNNESYFDNYTNYITKEFDLPNIDGSCYLFTINPNNYSIFVDRFLGSRTAQRKTGIVVIGIMIILLSIFSLFE